MTVARTTVPQPDLVRWVDPEDESIVGYEQTAGFAPTVVVEYGVASTSHGFVQVPRLHIRKVIAALTTIADDLDTLDAEGV